jgi:hypothetical protein
MSRKDQFILMGQSLCRKYSYVVSSFMVIYIISFYIMRLETVYEEFNKNRTLEII